MPTFRVFSSATTKRCVENIHEKTNHLNVFVNINRNTNSQHRHYVLIHLQVAGKGHCGKAELMAAKVASRKSSNCLDYEGLEVAVCRYGVMYGIISNRLTSLASCGVSLIF